MKARSFEIDGRRVGSTEPPYVIAELSANHNGSIERARKSIVSAKQCGAHAVKLQTYTADTMTLDVDQPEFKIEGGPWHGFGLYELYEWAHTPFGWHEELFQLAKEVGITVFSTPFDDTALDLLESLKSPAYKIASFELVDLPLISNVASTQKPIILSTGMATEEEVGNAIEAARVAGSGEIILLHCISSYPTPIAEAKLKMIGHLAESFGTPVGLSDHTMGVTASVAAVALGACVVEKHFTLSRFDKGPDSEFSIEPSELKELCESVNAVWRALGNSSFERPNLENESKQFRRSIYFVRDLPKGAIIKKEDIRRIRPGLGLAPRHFNDLIGKVLKCSVIRGTPTDWDQFES